MVDFINSSAALLFGQPGSFDHNPNFVAIVFMLAAFPLL